MTAYFDAVCDAMAKISAHPRAVFMGQSVACPGTAMYNTLEGVAMSKRVELPVAEDLQTGMAIGAALNGDLPVCIFPRWNFVLLAMSQLVLHLDKMRLMGAGNPKVIIRTSVGAKSPLYPGPQHVGNFCDAVGLLLETIPIYEVKTPLEVRRAYDAVMLDSVGSAIVVEHMELY